jgi:hypothetical protein
MLTNLGFRNTESTRYEFELQESSCKDGADGLDSACRILLEVKDSLGKLGTFIFLIPLRGFLRVAIS